MKLAALAMTALRACEAGRGSPLTAGAAGVIAANAASFVIVH
jgi:hypothetical protein